MSYLKFVPKGSIDALTWLGKKQWLNKRNRFELSESLVQSLLNEAIRYGRRFSDDVAKVLFLCSPSFRPNDRLPEESAFIRKIQLFVVSQVFATGKKTLLLSQALCEAFENTAVTVSFREYRQPYQTMVVELPARYAEGKVVDGLAEYPTSIAIHHGYAETTLYFDIMFQSMCATHILPYHLDESVDDTLQKMTFLNSTGRVDGETVQKSLLPYLRIALNAMLAMTYGIDDKKVAPMPQQRQVKKAIQKKAAGKDKFIAHRARLHLAALPTYFRFDQKIEAFGVQRPSPQSPSTTSGSPKKPHWRRGHWRQQAVGQGRAERELRWIRPMLIRADRFGGDLKDTKTTYTT
jgi:hypothetical protein